MAVAQNLLYVWFAIYHVVVEFVIFTLHPDVFVSLLSALFAVYVGLVGPAMAKTQALYVEPGKCTRRSVWFIGLLTPTASVMSRFKFIR